MDIKQVKSERNFWTWFGLKLIGILFFVFMMFRFVIPVAVNNHDDGMLAVGFLTFIFTIVATGWAAVSMAISLNKHLNKETSTS